MTALHNYTTYM